MTGVDRVEFAYLDRLLGDTLPLFALVATSVGPVLLDWRGAGGLAERFTGRTAWGKPDLLSRLSRKLTEARQGAEADVRRLGIARALPHRLAPMLRRHLPPGVAYLNTGHSNLTDAVFAAVRGLPGGRSTILIHDTIPLDYPQFTRPDTVALFEAKLRRVAAMADLVIYNSAQSRADAERHFVGWGRVPPGLVAHLGADPPAPDLAGHRAGANLMPDLTRPYFVTLGTIEPRKNHAMLLDIWQGFATSLPPDQIPPLLIIGSRGWMNEAVFSRLDALPTSGAVRELTGLPDRAVAALLQGASGALFPSHAEGFGLPLLEAAALGVPIICNDLPVYREFLADYPVYVPVTDAYLWRTSILALARGKRTETSSGRTATQLPKLPTWKDHFNLVLSLS